MATSTTAAPPKAPRLRGVVFDMDGTLTVPVIDFPAMYRTVLGEEEYRVVKSKNPSGIDILHHIESWSPDKQRRAYEIIADFEKQGLDRLQIMPGLPPFTRIPHLSSVLVSNRYSLFVYIFMYANRINIFFLWVGVPLSVTPSSKCLNFSAGASELCGFLESKNIK